MVCFVVKKRELKLEKLAVVSDNIEVAASTFDDMIEATRLLFVGIKSTAEVAVGTIVCLLLAFISDIIEVALFLLIALVVMRATPDVDSAGCAEDTE